LLDRTDLNDLWDLADLWDFYETKSCSVFAILRFSSNARLRRFLLRLLRLLYERGVPKIVRSFTITGLILSAATPARFEFF